MFFKAYFQLQKYVLSKSFKVRCSSINTPKNFIEVIHFISLSLINNDGSFNGILSLLQPLRNSVYLIYIYLPITCVYVKPIDDVF